MSHLEESLGEVTLGHMLCLMMSLSESEGRVSSESVGESYGVMPSVNCLRPFMVMLVCIYLLCSRTLPYGRHMGDFSCDPGGVGNMTYTVIDYFIIFVQSSLEVKVNFTQNINQA